MNQKFRILLITDPGLPVPPIGYGGIERVAGLLAFEYYTLGHHVTVLASKGSKVDGCTMRVNGKQGYPQSKWSRFTTLFRTWFFLILNFNKFDIIQNFGRLLYLLPVLKIDVKKIMCYQRTISTTNIYYLDKLFPKNLVLSGCSKDLIADKMLIGNWKVVYNPFNVSFYSACFSNEANAPLIFLSRINKEKGCHIAIRIALQTNNKLVIAGNRAYDGLEAQYFEEYIEPHIDGDQIVYVGEVNDIQKNYYLGKAKAMLFPILWDEPFGIVMIEAMATGTPVIAFNRGSVDEVIDEGITGYKVKNENEMCEAVSRIDLIDRKICREQASQRFDIKVIASNYLSLN